jgi:spore cortex formation protein SpoVR/YcgB (stage V sporulation)
MTAPGELLFQGRDWDFDLLRRMHDTLEVIARDELGLDCYPTRIEVITAEQMLDAYASVGMPLFYKHWSFGKHFAQQESVYRQGLMGLAYEIVINSDPCLCYVMEENTATMQALVIAHAAFGHNHFFKGNNLFRQWTDAGAIIDYLEFARGYIARCEESHGAAAVERILDAAHALQSQGIHRYPRKRRPDLRSEERRARERREYQEQIYNDLWRTVPVKNPRARESRDEHRRALMELPQENVLYFLEKTAPRLQPWQREILRIVRNVAQYFYPQRQTKLMNEGCATYTHYRLMTRLHETGRIDDGSFLEFLQSHTNVIRQPHFDDPHYGGWNPYALGFAMMQDIERVATEPTDEDRDWFPAIAGCGDPMGVLREAWSEYRDESFVAQFLSPRLMRSWRMFHLVDDPDDPELRIDTIHNERGFVRLRRTLAKSYDVAWTEPDIQVLDVDLEGDRRLILQHKVTNGLLLDDGQAGAVLQHLADLWGYDVVLREVSPTGEALREHARSATHPFS